MTTSGCTLQVAGTNDDTQLDIKRPALSRHSSGPGRGGGLLTITRDQRPDLGRGRSTLGRSATRQSTPTFADDSCLVGMWRVIWPRWLIPERETPSVDPTPLRGLVAGDRFLQGDRARREALSRVARLTGRVDCLRVAHPARIAIHGAEQPKSAGVQSLYSGDLAYIQAAAFGTLARGADHRSKSVDEFADQSFDCVITVCDNAKESCPIFPGRTNRIHWSIGDPAAVEGSEEQRLAAFRRIRDELREGLRSFLEHRVEK